MTRLAPLLTSLVAAAALTLVGTPAATALGPTAIAPGYDLFRTDPNVTSIGVPGVLEPIHFRGVPIETYNFGTGPTAVADTDTIVQRAGVAPQQPVGTVQLVKLQMQGVEEPTLFITLQSDRGRNPADPAVGPP
ncbi:MAG: hypothetical protein QOI63_1827, partial [Thermoplasmata archaeon]|nr:hypothetical protein [Thermoplasmata archaeon]